MGSDGVRPYCLRYVVFLSCHEYVAWSDALQKPTYFSDKRAPSIVHVLVHVRQLRENGQSYLTLSWTAKKPMYMHMMEMTRMKRQM